MHSKFKYLIILSILILGVISIIQIVDMFKRSNVAKFSKEERVHRAALLLSERRTAQLSFEKMTAEEHLQAVKYILDEKDNLYLTLGRLYDARDHLLAINKDDTHYRGAMKEMSVVSLKLKALNDMIDEKNCKYTYAEIIREINDAVLEVRLNNYCNAASKVQAALKLLKDDECPSINDNGDLLIIQRDLTSIWETSARLCADFVAKNSHNILAE